MSGETTRRRAPPTRVAAAVADRRNEGARVLQLFSDQENAQVARRALMFALSIVNQVAGRSADSLRSPLSYQRAAHHERRRFDRLAIDNRQNSSHSRRARRAPLATSRLANASVASAVGARHIVSTRKRLDCERKFGERRDGRRHQESGAYDRRRRL